MPNRFVALLDRMLAETEHDAEARAAAYRRVRDEYARIAARPGSGLGWAERQALTRELEEAVVLVEARYADAPAAAEAGDAPPGEAVEEGDEAALQAAAHAEIERIVEGVIAEFDPPAAAGGELPPRASVRDASLTPKASSRRDIGPAAVAALSVFAVLAATFILLIAPS
ncbi:MAG: hypothetical protein AB7L41_05320 [Flavobacteriaceae bacterium]